MARKVTRKSTNCVIFGRPKVISSSTLPSYEDVIRASQFERITLLEISRKELAFSAICQLVATRGGVEAQGSRPRPRTQTNFEAKDRPSRGQGQGQRRESSPKQKQKRSSNFFSGDLRKKSLKIFFRRSLLEETKKKVFADFPQGFWRFPTKFQRFKNSAVLEPRIGQFSRT